MTMYLPNPDIQPTGAEAAEFIDVPAPGGDAIREAETILASDAEDDVDLVHTTENYARSLIDTAHRVIGSPPASD